MRHWQTIPALFVGLLVALSIAAPGHVKAQLTMTGVGGAFGGAVAYTGPGDVVGSASYYGGVRSWNAAYATGSNAALIVSGPTTYNIKSNGFIDPLATGQLTTLTDQSGSSNNATTTASAAVAVGTSGGPFSTTALKIAVTNSTSNLLTTGIACNFSTTLTFVAWINPTAIGSLNPGIFGGSGSQCPELRYNTSGKLDFLSSSAALVGSSTGTISAATWTHVAVTYNSSTGATAFYINGSASGTASSAQTFLAANHIIVGGDVGDGGLAGSFGEAIIYNTVLNATQISNLKNNPSN